MKSIIAACASFAVSAAFVAFMIKLARKRSWFDHHDQRKIHTGEVPRLGGIGFAGAYILVALVLTASNITTTFGARIVPVLIAMPLILIFGVVDDFKPLRPRYKLLVQMTSAALVLSAGYVFHRISFAPIGLRFEFGLWGYPLTFLWLVGVTNALNLIDGVDGLAGGVSAIISVTFAAIFAAKGNMDAALLCVTLATALGGFLVFNAPLPSAKIFMGDGGSQFLGFTLAMLPLLDDGAGGASLPLPFAAALLLIPIFDTFAAIWRRKRDGRRIDSPDRAHMHHKLMNLGFDARGVDAVVYSLQIVIGALVYLSVVQVGIQAMFYLAAAYAIALAFFTAIHFLNRAVNAKRTAAGS